MQRWDYKILEFDHNIHISRVQKELNCHGEAGWRVIQARLNIGDGSSFLLERELKPAL